MELFLFFTSMLKTFDFLPGENGEVPTLKVIHGLINFPVVYKVRAVMR